MKLPALDIQKRVAKNIFQSQINWHTDRRTDSFKKILNSFLGHPKSANPSKNAS